MDTHLAFNNGEDSCANLRLSSDRPERLCALCMLRSISLLFCRIDPLGQHDEVAVSVSWEALDFETPSVLLYDFTGDVELQPQCWRFTLIAHRDDRFRSCLVQLDRD